MTSRSQDKHDLSKTLKTLKLSQGKKAKYYSLPVLSQQLDVDLKRLPVSIRIVLESVLRNCDNKKITFKHVKQIAHWEANAARVDEIPFVVARVILQDFTGVPLLADLAAMRSTAESMGKNPKVIEPLVPVDLVVDHSVMIDHYGSHKALDLNMKLEFERNNERYQFLKWGMQAFNSFNVVPPGFGIVHQVNLEYLARTLHKNKQGVLFPDTLVGTDSHTTMINALGVVGWGVGGIEAEAAMLGQPIYMLTPDVVGVHLTGRLRGGITATDLVLTITELLRKHKVVGKFVEFFGEGAESLALTDRATIANMAPEYGATMGFFPIDTKTVGYLKSTGRNRADIEAFEAYYKAQGLFGMPKENEIQYSSVVKLNLNQVTPSLAGPKRPQDRIELGNLKRSFADIFTAPSDQGGFNIPAAELGHDWNTASGTRIRHGDVLIAAITSCTNTSNPSVMLAAGLLAKKAVERGLKVKSHVKTSLAPGSRVVSHYLNKAGLTPFLEKLGFNVAAYGCTTCIGNSGSLAPEINQLIQKNELICAAVLSGNRNFEARIHPNLKANFLASPPLVIALAIAGNVHIDLMTQPVGRGRGAKYVYLGDIWPSSEEVEALMKQVMSAKAFKENYAAIQSNPGTLWNNVKSVSGQVYNWPQSTYIAQPPFFDDFSLTPNAVPPVRNARALAIFGDSITTDHISPAGSIQETSPAGKWLIERQVTKTAFNSYGARRGNHDVMMRGTFANVRIKNHMLPPQDDGTRVEGGLTVMQPTQEVLPIYEASKLYIQQGISTIIFAGEEYGTGSSRDWAAKGTQLLGVRAVIARSFERIHRSNLIGMGVIPLQFIENDSVESLGIQGDEEFDLFGIDDSITPQQRVTLIIRKNGLGKRIPLKLRIDTPIEVDYYHHGGILPFVLRGLLA